MDWLPWSSEAFERAAREGKPVLLSITAAWCRACHEMDRTTYADPAVAALARRYFVAVRVDSDRRPDINDRYNLGGWPTTAFLTPGGALIGGGTFIAVERMPGVLTQVAEAFAALERQPLAPSAAPPAERPDAAASLESVFATFDAEHGGFGIEPKFPVTAPLHLALALARTQDDRRWIPVVERTLDAIAGGGLHDPRDGGYFRYAATRDWQLAHEEKLLDTNAALLAIFADAAATLGRPADRERTAMLSAFIRDRLRAPSGAFAGSLDDPVAYMDSNGAALSALLAAGVVLEDRSIVQDALASFERVLLACYRPGAGVAHYVDGEPPVRALLADHVAALIGLLDAFALTGDVPYRMMAEELAHFASGALRDPAGGFRDRAPATDDVGRLAEPYRPFVANCDAVRAFRRLGRATGERGFFDTADEALRAAGSALAGQGPLAAHYFLARLEPAGE